MVKASVLLVVGIDLGGTFVRAGVFNTQEARLLAFEQAPIEAAQGPAAGIARVVEVVDQAIAHSGALSPRGIGIGCSGPVDPIAGTINNPYTLPGWDNVDIVTPLATRFNVPVVLENDADAAALGEYWCGAGRDIHRLYAITVGTGIGTAFILEGQVYRGLDGSHPEGGHQIIDPSGPPCYCGARGCWESLASGTAIAGFAQAQVVHQPDSQLLALAQGEVSRIDARLVMQAAQQDDPLALSILDKAAEAFCLGLVNVITLFVPQVIVLSGGVMRSSRLYMPYIERAIAGHASMVPAQRIRIVPAELGYQAGAYGAAYTILNKLTGEK